MAKSEKLAYQLYRIIHQQIKGLESHRENTDDIQYFDFLKDTLAQMDNLNSFWTPSLENAIGNVVELESPEDTTHLYVLEFQRTELAKPIDHAPVLVSFYDNDPHFYVHNEVFIYNTELNKFEEEKNSDSTLQETPIWWAYLPQQFGNITE